MEKVLNYLNEFNAAKLSISRTEFILSLIDDEDEKEKITIKHNELSAFCEKIQPMADAVQQAAKPYIDFIEAENLKLSS